jgi:hypothetical protein
MHALQWNPISQLYNYSRGCGCLLFSPSPRPTQDRVVLQNLGLYNRLDPLTFRSWTNALNRLPNATLWLLRATNEGESRLDRSLLAAGVDTENNRDRVRFSDPVGREVRVLWPLLHMHLIHAGRCRSMCGGARWGMCIWTRRCIAGTPWRWRPCGQAPP